jgi:transposase-like protein
LAAIVTQADALQKTQRSWKNRQHARQYRPVLPNMVRQTSAVVEETLEQQLEEVQNENYRLCQADAELKRDCEVVRISSKPTRVWKCEDINTYATTDARKTLVDSENL